MALPKSLTNLCLDGVYDYAKTIINHVSKSGKKERARLLSALHRIIRIFNSWNLRNVIHRSKYENHDVKWKFRIGDLKDNSDYTTLSFNLQSSAEFERFKAFLRHLVSNWFQDLKVQELKNGFLKYIVTHPVPVLLDFYPHYHTDWEEDSRFSNSSDVRSVVDVVTSLLTKDFCLWLIPNETEKLCCDKAESKTLHYPTSEFFRGSGIDLFASHPHYEPPHPDRLLKELENAYLSASNVHQYPVLEKVWLPLDLVPGQSARNQSLQLSHESQSSQTTATNVSTTETQTDFNYEKLFESIEAQRIRLQLQIDELTNELKKMAEMIKEKEAEMNETLSELGRVSVELTRMENEKKRNELFKKTYKSQTTATQTSGILEVTTSTPGAGLSSWSNQATSTVVETYLTENGNRLVGHDASFPMSIQESLSETESLTSAPTTSGVERNIYNNYKLLLLKLASGLLADDVDKLKQWVENEFQIDASSDVNTIFQELDRKKAISVTDLSRLKKFFEDNLRYDLVHLIDSYNLGEYERLKGFKTTAGSGSVNIARRSSRPNSSEIRHTSRISQGPTGPSLGTAPVNQRNFPGISRSNFSETSNGRTSGIPTQSFTERYVPVSFEGVSSGRGKEAVKNVGSSTSQGVVVLDGGGTNGNERQGSAHSTTARRDGIDTSRNTERGSNGQKLSKFSRPDSSGDDLDNNWLCSHYKRRCYVRFECCNRFWPCHRCHNNQSTCGRKKLKSRDTIRIKCAACGQEQQFAHYCSRCNAKFARYFCALCKHLTGTDDNPYHCDKCGICRIHGDRSFHCDICGVCLDVQLRGNHKCREGSAHDECCICLEDAFTGCQILPCSHKVHKECATQMIRSGIRRCPICRESFAHKLERKLPPSKKPPGKE